MSSFDAPVDQPRPQPPSPERADGLDESEQPDAEHDLPAHRFDDEIEAEHQSPDAPHVPGPQLGPLPAAAAAVAPGANDTAAAAGSGSPALPSLQRDDGDDDHADDDDATDQPGDADLAPASDSAAFLRTFFTAPSSAPRLVTSCVSELGSNGSGVLASLLSLIVAVGRPLDASYEMAIEMDDSGRGQSPQPTTSHEDTHSHLCPLITPDRVVRNEPNRTVSELAAVLSASSEAGGRVPSLGKDRHSRRIRNGFESVWKRLAAQAGDAIVFDTDCFETIISWLAVMTVAVNRGLRAAACLAAYRMVDGFITFGGRLRKQLSGLQRQFNLEKVRCGIADGSADNASGKSLSAKGRELKRKVEDLTANESELTELCDKVFRSVFIMKFRDVAREIRIMTINALGGWILTFPQHFLDDVHNKYIGWLLSDKDAGVRKASLDVLGSVLRKKEYFPSLELLLQRFRDRVVEMSRDKDDHVAVCAIQLLNSLSSSTMLDQHNCEAIYTLAIEEPQPELRRSAGQFLANMIIFETSSPSGGVAEGDTVALQPSKRKRKGAPRRGGWKTVSATAAGDFLEIPPVEVSRDHIKRVLFTVADRDEEGMRNTVDAVWDHLPALQCWEAYDDLVLERPTVPTGRGRRSSSTASGRVSAGAASRSAASQADILDDSDKAAVCEILLLSAIEVSGHGDKKRAEELSKAVLKNGERPAMAFSRHMIVQLPNLLTQFQADARAMKALVQLPAYLCDEALEQEGRGDDLNVLLERLINALTRHTAHADVAQACSKTFRALLNESNPLKEGTITLLQEALAAASSELSVAVRADLADSEPQTVSAALLRVRVLGELVQTNEMGLYDPIVKLLRHHLERGLDSSLEADAVCDTLRIAGTLNMWALSKIQRRVESMRESGLAIKTLLNTDDMKDVQKRGSLLIELLASVCTSAQTDEHTRIVGLPALLTDIIFCQGIERRVVEFIVQSGEDIKEEKTTMKEEGVGGGNDKKPSDEENTAEEQNTETQTKTPQELADQQRKMEDQLDLLDIKARCEVLGQAVSRCVVDLMRYERSSTRKRGQGRPASRKKAYSRLSTSISGNTSQTVLSAKGLLHCFSALIQASMDSAIAKQVGHLPLLGLAVKPHRSAKEYDEESATMEASFIDLVRQYYDQRVLARATVGTAISDIELRAVVDAEINPDNDGGSQHGSSASSGSVSIGRDVAEAMALCRRGVSERNATAMGFINGLATWASKVDNDNRSVELTLEKVRILCTVGTGLLSILTEDGATGARGALKEVEEMLEQDWITGDAGMEVSAIEGFVKALEVIADGRGGKPGRRRQLNFDLDEDTTQQPKDGPPHAAVEGLSSAMHSAQAQNEVRQTGETPSKSEAKRRKRKADVGSSPTPSRRSDRCRRQVNYSILDDDDNDDEDDDDGDGDGGEVERPGQEQQDTGKEASKDNDKMVEMEVDTASRAKKSTSSQVAKSSTTGDSARRSTRGRKSLSVMAKSMTSKPVTEDAKGRKAKSVEEKNVANAKANGDAAKVAAPSPAPVRTLRRSLRSSSQETESSTDGDRTREEETTKAGAATPLKRGRKRKPVEASKAEDGESTVTASASATQSQEGRTTRSKRRRSIAESSGTPTAENTPGAGNGDVGAEMNGGGGDTMKTGSSSPANNNPPSTAETSKKIIRRRGRRNW